MRIAGWLIVAAAAVYAVGAPLPDSFLGTPFTAYSYDAGDSAQYRATLVHYPLKRNHRSWRWIPLLREFPRRRFSIFTDLTIIFSSVNLPKKWILRAIRFTPSTCTSTAVRIAKVKSWANSAISRNTTPSWIPRLP